MADRPPSTHSNWAVDRVTNYRSRYGYPRRVALVAELWWRLEHCGIERVELFAYPRRKAAERKGAGV